MNVDSRDDGQNRGGESRGGENRDSWNEDDFELEREFADVSSAWQASRSETPRVPSSLDRKIREQARYAAGEEIYRHWIFSQAPQLGLAATFLFAAGLYFVMTSQNERVDVIPPASDIDMPVAVPLARPDAKEEATLRDASDEVMRRAAERSAAEYRLEALKTREGSRESEEATQPMEAAPQPATYATQPGRVEEVIVTGQRIADDYRFVEFRFQTDAAGKPVDPEVVRACQWLPVTDSCVPLELSESELDRARDKLLHETFDPGVSLAVRIVLESSK